MIPTTKILSIPCQNLVDYVQEKKNNNKEINIIFDAHPKKFKNKLSKSHRLCSRKEN